MAVAWIGHLCATDGEGLDVVGVAEEEALSIHQPDLLIHQPDLTIHQQDLIIHRLDLSIHRPDMSIHQLDTSIHQPNMSIHQLDLRVGVPRVHHAHGRGEVDDVPAIRVVEAGGPHPLTAVPVHVLQLQ